MQGRRVFTADALLSNAPMLRVFDAMSARITRRVVTDCYRITIEFDR